MLPLARVRHQSVEIATSEQAWRGDDTVVLLTTLSERDALVGLQELFRVERQAQA